MLIELVLLGLIFEAVGVVVLVRGVNYGFDYVLKHLGRTVPDDFEERTRDIHRHNSRSTYTGITLLIVGIIFQIYGTMVQCYPIIFGCNIVITV